MQFKSGRPTPHLNLCLQDRQRRSAGLAGLFPVWTTMIGWPVLELARVDRLHRDAAV
jgi:hypothetical protein